MNVQAFTSTPIRELRDCFSDMGMGLEKGPYHLCRIHPIKKLPLMPTAVDPVKRDFATG
jgi:hypothetical protein